jgi:hypothetical protein
MILSKDFTLKLSPDARTGFRSALEEIRRNCEAILCVLKERAFIKDYLIILVSRKVRDMMVYKNAGAQEL